MGDMSDEFVARFGEDAFQRLCEAAWAREDEPGFVVFSDHHMLNAANWRHEGTVTVDEIEYFFELENGDRNGTVFRFGENLKFERPPEPARRTFVPIDPNSSVAKAVFPIWQKEAWFREKVRAMNYDFYFAPGVKTQNHYVEWAAKRGLRITTEVASAAEIGGSHE